MESTPKQSIFFIKVTVLPDVSDHDRAILFSNVATSRLALWKAYYRVGKIYAALDDHEKAINSFERAFALDPTKQELYSCINTNRR
ncbi:unnamed protein product [Adineta ricciae]|uniref:Tetratricopeptide repeat protein n=1 Tax=Adineta ricciae TaxID=249248 RepID=A0A815H8Y7_ADIRI|nr:unnamed protein product [Adineta ricciae]CAF1393186.1 unnamed protein product [Adineta ricciae]